MLNVMDSWDVAKPFVEETVEPRKGYRRNRCAGLSEELKTIIYAEWQQPFMHFGYEE